MLIKGFEEEILTLLHRIKVMKGQDSQVFNRRKNNFVLSHSKRVLKKLEWSMNYNRSYLMGGRGREGWAISSSDK